MIGRGRGGRKKPWTGKVDESASESVVIKKNPVSFSVSLAFSLMLLSLRNAYSGVPVFWATRLIPIPGGEKVLILIEFLIGEESGLINNR